MKKTAIVILNYNNVGDTINCVDSVLRYESPDSVKVVLVDNASKEEVYVEIRRYLQQKCNELLVLENGCQTNALPEELPFVTYLRNERNLGYGKGNNSALRILENDKTIGHVMILNNDTIFVQPIAANLAAYLDQR